MGLTPVEIGNCELSLPWHVANQAKKNPQPLQRLRDQQKHTQVLTELIMPRPGHPCYFISEQEAAAATLAEEAA